MRPERTRVSRRRGLRARGALAWSLIIHALVFGSGFLLLHPGGPSRSVGPVFVSMDLDPREQEVTDEVPPPEVEEVAPPELEPIPEPGMPLEAAPDDQVLPPMEPPPEEVPMPSLLPPIDIVGKRTRPRRPPPPPPTAPPDRTTPTPQPAPPGTRTPLQALRTPSPPFPRDLVPPGTTVVLWLTYTIAADGSIQDSVVSESSGYAKVDSAVRDFVVANWKYVPPGSTRRVTRRFVFEPTE